MTKTPSSAPATSSTVDDATCPDVVARRRVEILRAASQLGALPSAVIIAYAALSWDAPNRPAMVAVATALLTLASAVWAAAGPIVRSRFRQSVGSASVILHLVGFGVVSHLDGGVTSPMGMMVWVALTFKAIDVPYRPLAFFAIVSIAVYWTVVALGEPVPPGYPWMYTLGFLGISAVCARHAGSLASLRRRLGEVAMIDPLTGCLNRRGFDERLEQERSKANRTGSPFTLVLIDLDAFKSVNDTHGHQAGDELLAWTGRTLRATARTEDVVGRVGGDEFALILTDAGPAEAGPAVDRLRAALGERSPASMGAASHPVEATDAADLRHLADQRVYDDKARREGIAFSASPADLPDLPDLPGGRRDLVVSSRERRRESFVNIALLGSLNFTVGFVHGLFFRTGDAEQGAIVAATGTGLLLGLLMLAGAGRISRSRHVSILISALTLPLYLAAVVLTAVDGGLESIYLIGTLTPLPIIALGTPLRTSVPAAAIVVVNVCVQGTFIGSPGAWYAILHLVGILAISIACGVSGTTAARQRKLLTQLSLVDALTGTLNRRGFEARFEAELSRVRRHGGTLGLLVLDLDGFKQVNDTLGHAAGDELLRWVSDTLEDALRAHDVVGRLGGDEFVVLLSGCPADRVARTADRVRERLADRTETSVGAAVLGTDGDDFDALYRHADNALYAEKAWHRETPTAPSDAGPFDDAAGPALRVREEPVR